MTVLRSLAPPRRPRLIIHAGFHKTGTTSIQDALRLNRALLSPHMTVFVKTELGAVFRTAGRFGIDGDESSLHHFRTSFARLLERLDLSRPVVLSMEGLAGAMFRDRGHWSGDVHDYAHTAPELARAMAEVIRSGPGDRIEPVFLYTTRAGAAFLKKPPFGARLQHPADARRAGLSGGQ